MSIIVELTDGEADAVVSAIQERLKGKEPFGNGLANTEGTAVRVLEKALEKLDKGLALRGVSTL